jgi:hypothetical protein
MISLLIFIIVVLIVMGLLIYAVQMMPIPGTPPWIKQIIMVVIILIAALVIAQKAGIAAQAQQPTPTPILKKTKPTTGTGYGATVPATPRAQPSRPARITGWQQFNGATKCVQQGDTVMCDNGLTQRVR